MNARARVLRLDAQPNRDLIAAMQPCPSEATSTDIRPTAIAAISGIPSAVVPIRLRVHQTRHAATAAPTARVIESAKMTFEIAVRDAVSTTLSEY